MRPIKGFSFFFKRKEGVEKALGRKPPTVVAERDGRVDAPVVGAGVGVGGTVAALALLLAGAGGGQAGGGGQRPRLAASTDRPKSSVKIKEKPGENAIQPHRNPVESSNIEVEYDIELVPTSVSRAIRPNLT